VSSAFCRPLLAALTPLALVAVAVRAQPAPREVGSSANAWFDVTADLWLTPTYDLQLGGKVQRAELGAAPQLAELRLGLVRPVGRRVRVAAGGLLAHYSPYGPFPAAAPYGERRLWQYVLQEQTVGRVALQHRYRLEERWIARPQPPAAGVAGPADVAFGMRARYRLQATLPVGPAAATHAAYVAAYAELLKSVGPHASTTLVDQNRVYAGAGVRWSRALRAEAGYLEQRILRDDGRQLEHGHTVQLALWLTRPAPRRAGRAPAARRD
jgi:hypothetical protein